MEAIEKTNFNTAKGIATKETILRWTKQTLDKVSFSLFNTSIILFVIDSFLPPNDSETNKK